jgi:hypothetical protein
LHGIEKSCPDLGSEMARHGQDSKLFWLSETFREITSIEHLAEHLLLAFLLGLPTSQPGLIGDFEECPKEQRYLINALVNHLQRFLHDLKGIVGEVLVPSFQVSFLLNHPINFSFFEFLLYQVFSCRLWFRHHLWVIRLGVLFPSEVFQEGFEFIGLLLLRLVIGGYRLYLFLFNYWRSIYLGTILTAVGFSLII